MRPAPVLERARGAVSLTVARRDGRNSIADLAQAGCGRLLFPAIAPGAPLEAVLLNTGGGLTGGDVFETRIDVESGAGAIVTTQACEKIYRAAGEEARVVTRLSVAPGGHLVHAPQETILFDGSRLARRLEADVAGDAALIIAEAVILGRAAYGETLTAIAFRDSWRIRRDGRLVFAEELALGDRLAEALTARATLGGARAFATLVGVGLDSARIAETARLLSPPSDCEIGVSDVGEAVVARALGRDGAALRSILPPLLTAFGSALPRLWSI